MIVFLAVSVFCNLFMLFLFYRVYKSCLIIKKNAKLQQAIDYLQEVPAYNTNTKMISNVLCCAVYIEEARRSNSSVLINGAMMGTLDAHEAKRIMMEKASGM